MILSDSVSLILRLGVTSEIMAFFEDAVRIFEGPTVEQVDDWFDYGELRINAIGLVNGIEITVIYTDIDDEERRVISAWRAEPYERRFYWKTIKDQS